MQKYITDFCTILLSRIASSDNENPTIAYCESDIGPTAQYLLAQRLISATPSNSEDGFPKRFQLTDEGEDTLKALKKRAKRHMFLLAFGSICGGPAFAKIMESVISKDTSTIAGLIGFVLGLSLVEHAENYQDVFKNSQTSIFVRFLNRFGLVLFVFVPYIVYYLL